ncbi:MAG: ATP-binding cassette domain-containing protein [Candidatus Sulfobium sp.]|jgi:tungstate transport system ATP-binding protein
MALVLKIEDLWKAYPGSDVLRGCNVSFDRRGVYVLTGPNGSGKSTFLRLCALLEEPDRGNINYLNDGLSLGKDIALKRRITLVLPKAGIFNSSVFGNMAYGLKVRGVKKSEIAERVDRCLESFGLADKRKQNALTLSSGEGQRLSMARAMVTEPEMLFLDEPTASVDHKNSSFIEELIFRMKEREGPTVVMTTHDVAQAGRLADDQLTIRQGRIIPLRRPGK